MVLADRVEFLSPCEKEIEYPADSAECAEADQQEFGQQDDNRHWGCSVVGPMTVNSSQSRIHFPKY
jgi:hypothetical protein